MLNNINIPRNDLYSIHQVPENRINPIQISSYGLSFNESCSSLNLHLRCSICQFHCNQSCYGSLFGNFIKNDFLEHCPECGVNGYAEHDQNIEKSPQKSPTFRFYNQAKSINYSTSNSNGKEETKSDISKDCLFNNKLYPSMNNSTKNIQDVVYHPKNINSDPYLSKIICKDTFSDCSPKNTLYYNSPTLNHNELVKCDIKHIVNEEQLNDQLLQKQCLSDLDVEPIDLEDDEGSCIDVEDSGYELKEEKLKKRYIPVSKRREYPKRKHFKTSAYRRSLRFKEITNNVTVSSVLKSFRSKKRFLKKRKYICPINSSEKHTKSIKESSDPLTLKKKTSNLINSSEELELHDKSKGISRKRKRCQDTDEYSLNDVTHAQEFSHLFRSAPRLPVEIKDGQRLGKKYRRRYNICDLTYVHVHRQISTPKVQFHDMNEDKDEDESSFDILNLIPREMVPVVTNNSQLGFKEAIIDKRLMRYKRGVPIFRVGRRVPGELS